MKDAKYYTGIILNILVPVVEIGLVCFLGPRILGFFMPFVIGWIIALIANPLVRMLESRMKMVRKHSSALIVIGVLAAVIGLSYFLISRLFYQAWDFAKELPELYAMVSEEIRNIFVRFDDIFRMLPENVQTSWQEFVGNVGQTMSFLVEKIASPTVEAAGNVAMRIPSLLVNVVVTILSSYFFIAEKDKIVEFWERHLSQKGNQYYLHLKEDVKRLVGGYFMAQFKIMFVVGTMLLIGFLLLGVNYAFLLAFLVSMLDFLPLFGTGTVLIPWALLNLLSGNYALAAGLAILYVLTQVVRQVIQPKIVGDSMGLPPLWTLIFLYIGFKVHGISGMILAVPIGIIVMNLYKYGMFECMIDNMKLLYREIELLRNVKSLDQDLPENQED